MAESYTVSTYILTNRGISSAAQGQVSVDYIGYTFTNAQLISYEGLPTALNFGLPHRPMAETDALNPIRRSVR